MIYGLNELKYFNLKYYSDYSLYIFVQGCQRWFFGSYNKRRNQMIEWFGNL